MTDQPIDGSHAARSTLGGSPFPPIADYGFLSDCEVSALVAPNGSVEWMCLPRMDGPSIFAAMLDRGAGWFQDADLQIMYGIGGERELTEYTLDHLSGYDGARPVRIGNGAWDQRQHDVWGVLLDSAYLHTRSRDRLDERRWPMLVRQVKAAAGMTVEQVAELQLAYPTFTECVSMAAQKICRAIGIGGFPPGLELPRVRRLTARPPGGRRRPVLERVNRGADR